MAIFYCGKSEIYEQPISSMLFYPLGKIYMYEDNEDECINKYTGFDRKEDLDENFMAIIITNLCTSGDDYGTFTPIIKKYIYNFNEDVFKSFTVERNDERKIETI